MEGTEESKTQREQLEKYLEWVKTEGGVEGPTHLSTWFKPHQQQRLRWLKLNCRGTIMELGCNWGFVLAYCNGNVGVDWNEKSIALAKILNPRKDFVVADIRKLPFPDNYVDTVLLPDVLEHLAWEDVPHAIAEGKRVAKKKILITIPNGDHHTSEAASFKHRYLLTAGKRQELVNMLKPWQVKTTVTYYFVTMEVTKVEQ